MVVERPSSGVLVAGLLARIHGMLESPTVTGSRIRTRSTRAGVRTFALARPGAVRYGQRWFEPSFYAIINDRDELAACRRGGRLPARFSAITGGPTPTRLLRDLLVGDREVRGRWRGCIYREIDNSLPCLCSMVRPGTISAPPLRAQAHGAGGQHVTAHRSHLRTADGGPSCSAVGVSSNRSRSMAACPRQPDCSVWRRCTRS